jgi:PHD/YefM family antitoxin component YafN of YafNO toxin-antitoxin module
MATITLLPIAELPRTRASDVKKDGWRAVVKSADRSGFILVTNHDDPAVVIVSVEKYSELVAAAGEAKTRLQEGLELLRTRFDERLAVLKSEDAGDRLRSIMSKPAKLQGKVKAGASY